MNSIKSLSAKTLVCLPTYNEARNLYEITNAVFRALPGVSILVIDDNSPDKTGMMAEHMALNNPQLSVLHRSRKEGLGLAYLDGFRHAFLSRHDVRRIVQMDADLSHPPELLPHMLDMSRKADLVIGSRYVAGGRTRNWGIHRRMISRFGSLYARAWLGIPVCDLTGGFKVWHRELLEQILTYSIDSGGYVFQTETTFLAHRLGACVREVPILFTDRYAGKSKMSAAIAFEACWRLPSIRWKKRL